MGFYGRYGQNKLSETSRRPLGNLSEPLGNLSETTRKPLGDFLETSRSLSETSRKPPPGLLRPWYFWHKIPGNFDENNSSKQQKFREFLHFLHTKFREFLRKKATSRCFFSKKFREFLLRKMAKIPGILKKKQCAQKLRRPLGNLSEPLGNLSETS